MTLAQAQAKWAKCLKVIEQLAEEFPCPECNGHGDKNYNGGMPDPCLECWGRGFQISYEEDD
jgi:hypothetical protein